MTYGYIFAGQGNQWKPLLEEQLRDPRIAEALEQLAARARTHLEKRTGELSASGGLPSMEAILEQDLSVPGIAAVQYGQITALTLAGFEATAAAGHSQGVLGAAMLEHDPAEIFAIAWLIGAEAERSRLIDGGMVSVRGVELEDYALKNGYRHYVLSGTRKELEGRIRGLDAQVDWLDVRIPFHSPLLGLPTWEGLPNPELAERLARAVLQEPVDWPAQVTQLAELDVDWLIHLGPGQAVAALTEAAVQGRGIGVADASTLEAVDRLAAGHWPERPRPWSDFAPKLRGRVETKFTRLTGKSPILLAGMTPTTVDPEIVAAAANAGFWAELAGGGQVTEEVFAGNLAKLKSLLKPGATAQFNAMFMDRYLWNLQFGAQRIVTKARESGAPFDGVVISAGIPDLEEAPALVEEFRRAGFAYVAFKPGTVEQIRAVLAIADALTCSVIMHVEDGHAGGHHSWENLQDLLRATYAEIRRRDNVVLCVGGGIGTPDRAADYLTGEWHDPAMPVDGVLIGTAAMTAKEAKTTEEVKDLLVATQGTQEWIQPGQSSGGVTSGLSHLRADMHEIDNSAAACARLIAEVEGDLARVNSRREEIIAALNKTSKPYFGELTQMTYAELMKRFLELSWPWVDISWEQRFWELLERVEARLASVDHGPVEPHAEGTPHAAVEAILQAYDCDVTLTPLDAAWFVELCRKYPKPMGFVPVIDEDLLRWWGQDSLWQSQDDRYPADAVRIIPGPASVGGITTKNEPIADLLGRFEAATAQRLQQEPPARRDIKESPFIQWMGHLMDNPAYHMPVEWDGRTMRIPLDARDHAHAVRELTIPLIETDGVPVVDADRLPESMRALLAGTAGVGNRGVTGDVAYLPEMQPGETFGVAHYSFTVSENLGTDHAAVTGGRGMVPDALLGPCWPAIYSALGSAEVEGPVIEGLLNAVHLDHTADIPELPEGRVDVRAWADEVQESSSGRVVQVNVELLQGEVIGRFTERFAIRGRVFGATPPPPPASLEMRDLPRKTLTKGRITAPADMSNFAWVSGDFNPIHTSYTAARVAGLEAPLVHGMWLSAAAQHMVPGRVVHWTYRMFGPVNLRDEIELQVERIGRAGGLVVQVNCRIDGQLVSQGTALLAEPVTAYVYPGQGIQSQGMGLEEHAVWDRADAHTRTMGFSIKAIVRDNPTAITVRGQRFQHPEGVLNLTQFTQVALATLAYAQTEKLRREDTLRADAYLAGHSLGEYNALSAFGVIDFETVLELVYQRGTTMHGLVERDEQGRSNYRMGALRPHGVDAKEFVAQVSEETGEFLEIVNYNLAGKQYAVAGTVAGIEALERKAQSLGERAFVRVPGVDVPFHSRVLRGGVADFRQCLDELLPQELDYKPLIGRYVPNLVARTFQLDREFVDAVLEVADSEPLRQADWQALTDAEKARILLVELLAWQFASPVRWIETQELLLERVEDYVEVGLASSPTLANLAARTQAMLGTKARILNVQRDEQEVFERDEPQAQAQSAQPQPEPEPPAQAQPVQSQPAQQVQAAPAEIPFTAADAIRTLLAYACKVRPDQIADTDTTGTLTNGVSSRLNQLLMDMSAELGLSSVEGAAEADIATLSATVNRAAFNYKPFGPVLGEAVKERLRKVFRGQVDVAKELAEWNLGEGWVAHVTAALLLGTREGTSARGGELGTLSTVEEALHHVAQERGVSLHKAATETEEVVAVDNTVLVDTARYLLRQLGHETRHDAQEPADTELMDAVTAELGGGWQKSVEPAFDARRAVLIDDRWATAREDLARMAAGEDVEGNFRATGQRVAELARWYGFDDIAEEALQDPGEQRIAVVTGMAPGSIAAAVVAKLLGEGACVIATASRLTAERVAFGQELYRRHAIGGAALWLVPANLASYRDVDALVEWIGSPQEEVIGAEKHLVKPAFVPDLFFPFAAPPVSGVLGDPAETQARVLLWGVERALAGLAEIGKDTHVDHRMHTVLPGSPNRGTFGGDGAYGETKAALDAIANKWHVEPWGQRVTLAHPRIGWVAGTNLMGGNDALVAAAEEAGVRVWSPADMATELLELCTPAARNRAAEAPLERDLTGGLDGIRLSDLRPRHEEEAEVASPPTINALPSPRRIEQPTATFQTTAQLEDTVVIVGLGEVSAWGSGRTRMEAEYGIRADGDVDLTAAGVLELAWMTGLLEWRNAPHAGWYHGDERVDESEIYARFKGEVIARSGVRSFVDDPAISDGTTQSMVEVFLEEDVRFPVEDPSGYEEEDPAHTRIEEVEGQWYVTRTAGASVCVPRRATLARKVGGQFPTDFDATRWGIPADMLESLDRMAVWNLVTTVDAYLSAGFSPAEILEAVDPADVAMTQGTGFGGMTSMRKLFVERFLEEDIPSDILQETLPNVIAAHTMQAYVGGYGAMIHPVGACATAAVSVEEGMDKIACGKADFVVAGAVDDISVESISGFASMNATADSDALEARGISERFYSRANDRRRAGFVEAQGGGTVLLARGSVAAKLGLPVYGVVAYAASFADGFHTSIPAPGLGALGAVRDDRLLRALDQYGVGADDIAVVSKHDTSTNANDPNETVLHTRMAERLGRSEGNPLFVVSQKSLTGHAKGGAAVFQISGLCDMLRTGRIPGNAALNCVDPAMADSPLVWPRTPLQLPEIRAGLLTSLGFGHVSAVVALVHPGAFYGVVAASLGSDAAAEWRDRATERLRAGAARREAGMLGEPLFERGQ
ncbi:MAG TPA: DUF1729 domain-containing protein [Candidatus Corynebacterium gallistercoris]|uniref:DUF1729 domain-containing protein n=1 Tax=Candidatus Corynebacterium gallistercoris TaxID=2838530 RepID=A0A9D1RX75_9CORY|nr:DUF1729 domain-containing protein [Candidatus Corynebacterium gallistercoris]